LGWPQILGTWSIFYFAWEVSFLDLGRINFKVSYLVIYDFFLHLYCYETIGPRRINITLWCYMFVRKLNTESGAEGYSGWELRSLHTEVIFRFIKKSIEAYVKTCCVTWTNGLHTTAANILPKESQSIYYFKTPKSPVVTICTTRFRVQKILQFAPHSCINVFLCGSENKKLLFPYTALTDWFL